MKSAVIVSLAVLASASGALATISSTGPTHLTRSTEYTPLPHGGGRGTTDQIYAFNVTGVESWDAYGDVDNDVFVVDVAAALGLPSGTALSMTSIGWDVTLTGIDTSWLSELRVYFDDAIAPDGLGLFLRPGAGTNTPGTASFASAQIDLSDNGIANILLPDGRLRLDFHESFDDNDGVLDGTWDAGSLNVGIQVVPAPASVALLGLGGLLVGRRRRT